MTPKFEEVEAFIKNKYYRWYYQIVDKARKRGVPGEYHEKHHVIPKCIGGKNDSYNVVNLTFREHYLAHWLLTKFTEGNILRTMNYALGMMVNGKYLGGKVPSRCFKKSKEAIRLARKGTKLSDEIKLKISRYKHTDEEKRKISLALKGRKFTEEHRRKIGLATIGNKSNFGRKPSEETRRKRSISMIGKNLGKKLTDEQREKVSKAGTKIFVDYLGNCMTIQQAIRASGNNIRHDAVIARLNRGWPHREAVEMPVGSRKKYCPSFQLG